MIKCNYIFVFNQGFCMDLLVRLANKVNFTFDLHLVEDGNFGSLQRVRIK